MYIQQFLWRVCVPHLPHKWKRMPANDVRISDKSSHSRVTVQRGRLASMMLVQIVDQYSDRGVRFNVPGALHATRWPQQKVFVVPARRGQDEKIHRITDERHDYNGASELPVLT